jgi:hypothetical protein
MSEQLAPGHHRWPASGAREDGRVRRATLHACELIEESARVA